MLSSFLQPGRHCTSYFLFFSYREIPIHLSLLLKKQKKEEERKKEKRKKKKKKPHKNNSRSVLFSWRRDSSYHFKHTYY